MKKLYSLLIALLISFASLSQTDDPCESCLPDGITFTTQPQIDSFPLYYPDCIDIEGDVIVHDDIHNLNGLENIVNIGGHLRITGTSRLSVLSGLDNLTNISGDLFIETNDSLVSLSGLDNLVSVQGNIDIGDNDHTGQSGNPLLSSLSSLSNLSYVGGNFEICGCGALNNLTGLENLNYLNGDLSLVSNGISSLDGLNNLDSIGGSLHIAGNALNDLSGLENLTSIGNGLTIFYTASLNNLDGLQHLTKINGGLFLKYNFELQSLSGLDSIDANSISELYIGFNTVLSECEVKSICNYIATPGAEISIGGNGGINSGCNSIEEVEEACESASVNELIDLQDLSIYPNPTNAIITIELPTQQSKNTTLTLTNTNGQQIITQQLTKPQTEIDISHLSTGIYIIKVWNDKDVMVQKVIKK